MLWCSSLSCSKKLLFGPFLLKCSQMTANFVKIVFKKIGYSLLDKKVKMQFLRLKKKKRNTHTLQTSALLCPFQRDYSSLAYTLSQPGPLIQWFTLTPRFWWLVISVTRSHSSCCPGFPKTDDIQKCFVLSVPVYGRAFFFTRHTYVVFMQ